MNNDFKNLHGVIVGLGSIGNRHLKNCLQLGVGQITVVRRANANSQFSPPQQATVVHTIDAALASEPDFVIVANPSHLHATTAIQCLKAGSHVLIEKPLGRSIGESETELATLSKASDRICAMAYCMRYHPVYRRAKELIDAGEIGDCLYAKAWFEGYLPDWHPWEDYRESYAALKEQGGGVLRTLDHELDFLNWVLGPAHSATGKVFNVGHIEIEADDLAMYSLEHSSGAISQVTTSFTRKPQSRGFEFVGKDGTITCRMEDMKLNHRCATSPEPKTLLNFVDYDINQMYVDLLEDFLTAVIQKPNSTATLESGLDCMKVFEMLSRDF